MKKFLLAAFAAVAFVAAPTAAPAQNNPLSPQTGVGTVINCILTCPHNEHSWWTAGKTKHSYKKWKWKYKYPKYGHQPQPTFRGYGKTAKFGNFGKVAKFGKAAKFGKFGKYSGFGRNMKFASYGKGPSFGFGKTAKFGKFGKAGKFGHYGKTGKFGKYGKFHKPHKAGRSFHKSSHGFPFYVGAMICSAAGPMINAALGGPEPTSEQVLEHMLGCFVPPIGVALMIRDLTQ